MAEPQYDFSTLPDKDEKTVSYDLSNLPDKPDPMLQKGMQQFDQVNAGGEEAKADPAKFLQEQSFLPIDIPQPRLATKEESGGNLQYEQPPEAGVHWTNPDRMEEMKKATTNEEYFDAAYSKGLFKTFKNAYPDKPDAWYQNALALSENSEELFGHYLPPNFVADNYDQLNKWADPTTRMNAVQFATRIPMVPFEAMGKIADISAPGSGKYVAGGAALIGTGIVGGIRAAGGLSLYHAQGEAADIILSFSQDRPHIPMQTASLADFMGPDIDQYTKLALDVLDVYAKGIIANTGLNAVQHAWRETAYETVSGLLPSQNFFMPGEFLTGMKDFYKKMESLGVPIDDVDLASKYGLDVTIAPRGIVAMMDSPEWATIKSALGLTPYAEVLSVEPVDASAKLRVAGELEAPTPITDNLRGIGKQAEAEGIIPKGITESVIGKEPASPKEAPIESDGTAKTPVGYKPVEGRTIDQETDLVFNAMAQVESGNKPDVSEKASGGLGRGRMQFDGGATGATWLSYSQAYAQDNGLPLGVPFTDANQTAVAKYKIRGWLEQGYSPKQIAAMWNGGESYPDWVGRVGKNSKTGVPYDVPGHVEKVATAYAVLSGKPLPEGGEGVPSAGPSPTIPTGPPVTSDTVLDSIIKPDLSVPEVKTEPIDTKMPTTPEAVYTVQPTPTTVAEESGVAKPATATEPWQKTREEHGVPPEPKDVTVPKYPRLEKKAREDPESLTETDKTVLAKQKEAKKEHAKYLKDHKQYVEKSNEHIRAVEDAVNRGEPVPEKVLAEYPHLARKAAGTDRGSMIEISPGKFEPQGVRDDSLVGQIKKDMAQREEAERQKKIQEQIDKGREIEEYCVDKQGKTKRFTIQKP